MKIAKGTMIFEKITSLWFELKKDVDDGDIIAEVLNMENKTASILMSNILNKKYYEIREDQKFLISQNNTSVFLAQYNKACDELKAKFAAAKSREEVIEIWHNAFYVPAQIIVSCMEKLDKSLIETDKLLSRWQL